MLSRAYIPLPVRCAEHHFHEIRACPACETPLPDASVRIVIRAWKDSLIATCPQATMLSLRSSNPARASSRPSLQVNTCHRTPSSRLLEHVSRRNSLPGMDPITINDICGKALAFWTYQVSQEALYQSVLLAGAQEVSYNTYYW